MSVKDYIKNIAPTPSAYKAIREEAKSKGTSSLSMREIDREIAAVRRGPPERKTKQPAPLFGWLLTQLSLSQALSPMKDFRLRFSIWLRTNRF